MKSNCEVCGHELGFFERSLKIDNTRLGLSYQTLCSACRRSIDLAVDKIEAICTAMHNELVNSLARYRYASGDINVLIFLAVKELFRREPDFDDPNGILEQTFYHEEEPTVKTRFDYIVEMTYKILRNGFISVLGRYGLDTFESFAGYMGRECLFEEQQLCNCGPDGIYVYADLFVCSAGLVFYDTDNQIVRSLFISRDRTVKFRESHDGATYDLTILRQRFKNLKVKPEICFNRRDQRKELVKMLTTYNNRKADRIESELKALINNLNVPIEKDLRSMHPDDELSDIPLDSVLVSIIKTLFEEDIEQDYVKEAPDGLLSLIVERCYPKNFELSGIGTIEDIQDYISQECTFIWDFDMAYGNGPQMPAFAFLTPQAYMIKPISQDNAFMRAKAHIPSDLYCDYQFMIFEGNQEFYITTSSSQKNDEGYYMLSGVRLSADKPKILKEFEDYFSQKAFEYYESELEREVNKKDTLRDKEILDETRRIFVGYGYLPFSIYDEWASIESNLKKSDILMDKIIPEREPKTGTHNAKIFYTGKTVNSFEQQAAKLAENLGIKRLPVARALLWKSLQKEVLNVCAQEFIRLCGDIITEEDSLEDAFIKYSALSDIQTEKAYYLGLFIYYLMYKGLLDQTDFLDHYDQSVRLFMKYNPNNSKVLEFSELSVPDKKSFDSESIDFSNFNVEPEQETSGEILDSFLYSISQNKEDNDSIDGLIERLGEYFTPEEIAEITEELPDVELLSDLLHQLENETISRPKRNLNGVEFIDVDSEAVELEAPSEIIETVAVDIPPEEIEPEIKTKRKIGFDSVRTIIGFGRKKDKK